MNVTELLAQGREQLVNAREREAYQTLMAVLAQAPDNAEAYYLLSVIARTFGNFGQEVAMLHKAVEFAPQHRRYQVFLARALAFYGQSADAYQRLVLIDPADINEIDLLDAVAITYNRLYLYREACAIYERLVALPGASAASWYNLGTCYKYTGDFSRSAAALGKATALNPRYYKAHAALASLGVEGADKSHLETLKVLLAETAHVDDQLYLAHAMAKILEQQGEHTAAYDSLLAVKRRKKAALAYTMADDEPLFKKLHQSLAPDRRANNQTPSVVSDLFIVGLPRTGTTLLERILSGLPGVCSGGELYNFGLAWKKVNNLSGRSFIAADDIRDLDAPVMRQIGELYQSSCQYLRQQPVLTNKLPVNFLYAEKILEALPGAMMVCMDRNPMDTVLSNFRQLFSFDDGIYRYTLEPTDSAHFYLKFKALREALAERYNQRFYVLNYENLVSQPEREMQALVSFLGLPWDRSCLDIVHNTAPVATASAVQVREAIHTKSVGRWHRYGDRLQSVQQVFQAAGVPI